MKIKILVLMFLLSGITYSQSGANFQEFQEKLKAYFDEILLKDMVKDFDNLTDYTIWSWDVGDFSGDGFTDLAFSVTQKSRRQKVVDVYLYADIEGYLFQVAKFKRNYVELPLEAGVVIKDGTCFTTEKFKQFHWRVEGYRFIDGYLYQYDDFVTEKVGKLSKELYNNYVHFNSTTKFINPVSNQIDYKSEYFTFPVFRRGTETLDGLGSKVVVQNSEFIYKGAWYYDGQEDLNYSITSAYDDNYIYFQLDVIDDIVVVQNCDTCFSDAAELWVCLRNFSPDEFLKSLEDPSFKLNSSDFPIIKISLSPGNFEERPATFKISAPAELNEDAKLLAHSIKVVSNLTESGYYFKFKLPIEFFNSDFGRIANEDGLFPISFVVIDMDNEFRPEERSEMASSKFRPSDWRSYSLLKFMPENERYGKRYNIFKDKILQYMNEYGL